MTKNFIIKLRFVIIPGGIGPKLEGEPIITDDGDVAPRLEPEIWEEVCPDPVEFIGAASKGIV